MNRIPAQMQNCPIEEADYLTASSFVGETDFKNPFEIKTTLKNEIDGPNDDPIPVPVVKLMKFKLGQPEVKKFSL